MEGNTVSVERVIKAPASAIFAIVADATRHPEIDGSGSVVKAKDGAPDKLDARLHLRHVDEDGRALLHVQHGDRVRAGPAHRLADVALGAARTLHRRAHLALRARADADGGTKVTETWDISQDKQGLLLALGKVGRQTARRHDQDARPPGRADRVARRDRDATSGAAIDAAWDERVLPALCDYTRIPCLSPAFDPDWAEHGAHRRGGRSCCASGCDDQGAGAAAPRSSQLPGPHAGAPGRQRRQPATPSSIYGHMDKQPPLGEWRSGLGPYEPVREGDLLYGRGTADDGYATFAAVTGLAGGGRRPGPRASCSLRRARRAAAPTCRPTSSTCGERIGRPRLVICLDSGGLSYDRLWLTTSLRGNLVATVTVRRADRGHPQRAGRRRRAVVVPHPAPHPLGGSRTRTTGRILLPELRGRGSPRRTWPTSSHRWPGVPRQRGPRGRRAASCWPPTRSTAWPRGRGAPRSR